MITQEIPIIEYGVLFLSIIIHEIGHLVAFWSLGINPPVKITWFGIVVGNDKIVNELTVKEMIHVSLAGIVYGLLVLFVFDLSYGMTITIFLVYLFMCSMDIASIISLIEVYKLKGNVEIGKIQKI